ncbi:MAG: bifunctional glutamate N-acetyltransferase/amino-acid acetyltransferase ArgJ [Desulfarculaceae bacterium]|jgi:glutamate N-acetyltransferase/amino-acid N-acetyltransferase
MNQPPELIDAPLKVDAVITAGVDGFTSAAIEAGIRTDGRRDLALICAEKPAAAAGVFTQNRLQAAPVLVAREHITSGRVRAILANSGCANAATGREGMAACRRTCQAAAQTLDCLPQEIIPCSTGVIGQVLNAEKVEAVLPDLVQRLSLQGLPDAAQAIRTTDAFVKMAEAQAEVSGKTIRVAGLAKGAGMIRPHMATLLAFVLTDAAASPQALEGVLKTAAGLSFNRATVDGDTSTNDTLLLLASGRAGNPELQADDRLLKPLTEAVTKVCQDLAAMIVADGEGAGHLIRMLITGAKDEAQARHLAYALAHSQLCKTAFAGQDPNWGRLVCAAGAEASRRDLAFDPQGFSLWIGETLLVDKGVWAGPKAEEACAKTMQRHRYQVRLDIGAGQGVFWVLTSDLDHEYIKINAEYRS